MSTERGPRPILVVDDERFFHIIIAEALKGQVEIVAAVQDLSNALEALARLDTRAGIISDLKLTAKGLEGMAILEHAIRKGFRDLILFTSTPGEVPKAWLEKYPQVQLVNKTGLRPIMEAVAKWNVSNG